MVFFKKLTYTTKTKVFSLSFAGAVLLISILLITFGSRSVFNSEADAYLSDTAELKTLRFEADLGSQLSLVTQMARSPVIVRYMKNPSSSSNAANAMAEFESYRSSLTGDSIFWVSDSDKKFYSGMQYAYTVDPSLEENYWYKMTLYETTVYNFNIHYNAELKATMLWINAVVRDEEKTPIGMLGTGVPLDGLFAEVFRGIPDDITLYIYNSSG